MHIHICILCMYVCICICVHSCISINGNILYLFNMFVHFLSMLYEILYACWYGTQILVFVMWILFVKLSTDFVCYISSYLDMCPQPWGTKHVVAFTSECGSNDRCIIASSVGQAEGHTVGQTAGRLVGQSVSWCRFSPGMWWIGELITEATYQ